MEAGQAGCEKLDMTLTDAISASTLIVGDDPNLVYKEIDNLTVKLEELSGSELERVIFEASESPIDEVLRTWSQNFMFSPRALIILRNPSGLDAEEVETLLEATSVYSGDNYLVLANFSGTVDKGLRSYFTKKHALIDCSLKDKTSMSKFLGEIVHESGLRFDSDAFRLLSYHLGESVSEAVPILDLLKTAFGEGARVSIESLEPYLSDPGGVPPWDFTDAIEAGRTEQSIELLWRLMRSGKRHPLVIISILQRRLTELAVASGSGITSPSKALDALKSRDKKFNRPPFVTKKIFETGRSMGYSRLSQAFVWLSIADRQIKGEGGIEPELAVELLVARLSKSFSRN